MDGARARRTLWSLAVGHLAVLVATVPVATLIGHRAAADEPGYPFGDLLLALMFAFGAVSLAAAQVLTVRKLRALARATTDRIDIDQFARSLRRSAWPFAFTLYAVIFGLPVLLTAPAMPPLSALFLLLIIAAQLLEYSYAGWVQRCLSQSDELGVGEAYRLLPPGIGPRLRNGQSVAIGGHATYSGIAGILLVATIVTESRSAAGVPLASFVQIVAAAATMAIPLLHIPATVLVRAAIIGDMAHLPGLRRAATSFIRAGATIAPLTALVIASILATPAAPAVAIGRATLLVFVTGVAALQFTSLSSIRIGEFPERWLRAAGSGRR